MISKKITVYQLKNYLGTGLIVYIDKYGDEPEHLQSINSVSEEIETNIDCADIDLVRPICYRLQYLDKFIPELGFVPIEEILKIEYNKWFEEHKESRYSEIETEQVPNYVKAYFTFQATLQVRIRISDINHEPFWITQKLFEWHFWPFGEEYFEQGLVIDKMTIGKEVSND